MSTENQLTIPEPAEPSAQLATRETQVAQPAPQKQKLLANERGVQFTSLEDMWRFAVAMVNSNQFKGLTTEVAILKIQAGAELGLTPIWSLSDIAIINGKPVLYGDAFLATVLRQPDCEDVIEIIEGEGDARKATCKVLRKGRQPVTRSFTWAEAKAANLTGKGPWVGFGSRMLQMRARAFACRDAFADALRGVSMREEREDIEEKPAKVTRISEITLPE